MFLRPGEPLLYRVVVIADHAEAEQLVIYLKRQNPSVSVVLVSTLAELDDAIRGVDDGAVETRLISFCSSVIVPPRILHALGPTPYNIHPASPEFPGSHPDAFAVMACTKTYGATAHEMVSKVDAGTIVDVEVQAVGRSITASELRDLAFVSAVTLFTRIADHCALSSKPIPPLSGKKWGARKTTRKDYRALCAREAAPGSKMYDRLQRACGDDWAMANLALTG